MEQEVRLVWITPEIEQVITYIARVSNPKNQDNPDIAQLLKYGVEHKHWSIFEMSNMCVEITTTKAISAQILRHKSFNFQELSRRYTSQKLDYIPSSARRQDLKNRQNSIDDMPTETKDWFSVAQEEIWKNAEEKYNLALEMGIAKEVARMVLPMNTLTCLYMNGTIRSWIHYLQLRTDPSTQFEHREIANKIKQIFIEQLPIISRAMEWK